MGMGILPVFNKPGLDRWYTSDGKALAHDFPHLDELAEKLKIKKFSSFGDDRGVPDDFNGDPDDLDELLGEFDEWYEPMEAIEVFTQLASEILKSDPTESHLQYPDATAEDLLAIVRCLNAAEETGALFRLELL